MDKVTVARFEALIRENEMQAILSNGTFDGVSFEEAPLKGVSSEKAPFLGPDFSHKGTLKVETYAKDHKWADTAELKTQPDLSFRENSYQSVPSRERAIVLWRPLPWQLLDGSNRSNSQSSGS
jgi:hypothetical protein